MNQTLKNRLKRTAILAVIGVSLGAGITYYQIQNQPIAVEKESSIEPMAGAEQLNAAFALTDQDGKSVTNADYANAYKLVYFGFTSCPSICPTELQKISRALNDLGAEADNIQPIFITVDPERDNVETMKNYVPQFHPKLVGLTGNREAIDETIKNYKIYAAKAQDPSLSEYTMDHSSFIYFMTPDDKLITLYRTEDTAEAIAADIRKRLAAG
jgi:cytochrome oxidase Cu insertion factor (SCO1/SenC/PrrC family)